ncbi:RNA polymerase sigma factor [Sphingobacterium tabacisoli]|uniref:RNA polymerase sigma factor n=1 Tax=Sphingobacterium tabacisoli TaxID=2044855 RepID=A0ABW5L8L7_9SPHI|nr:sigma-70 family RNA polymerase sigma factor [Sphingobacterium tabacisoli]
MIDRDLITERELLIQLQGGNRTAFDILYRKYATRLTIKLLQLVKSEEIAQDLLQEIFMKIWQMRGALKEEQSFAALLYTMASNLSLNSYRAAVREQNRLMKIRSSESYTHIEEDIDFEETNKVLHHALSTLTDRQREVYTLHKLDGKSYNEISDLLQISHSAINQHIQQANKQIRVILKDHLPDLLLLVVPLLATNCLK